MITIRYYTEKGIYKGWNKYNDKNIEEAKEWLRNGHKIRIFNKEVTNKIIKNL
tara:strand:- start:109 stop:267 length:159 start_codon:yes stop_codon:yes gene_type:complete